MLKYIQSTGQLFQLVDGKWTLIGVGYAGNGDGLNNHAKEDVVNHGPIPCGLWGVSFPFKDDHRGDNCFRLTPITYLGGRKGFLIHADNSMNNNSASEGCIIMGPSIRLKLVELKPQYLLVEA